MLHGRGLTPPGPEVPVSPLSPRLPQHRGLPAPAADPPPPPHSLSVPKPAGGEGRRERAGGRRRRCAAGSRPREGGGSGRAAGRSGEGRGPQGDERALLPREEAGSDAGPRPRGGGGGRQGRAARTGRGLLQVLLQQRLLQQELEPGGLRRRAGPAGGSGFPVRRFRAHRRRLSPTAAPQTGRTSRARPRRRQQDGGRPPPPRAGRGGAPRGSAPRRAAPPTTAGREDSTAHPPPSRQRPTGRELMCNPLLCISLLPFPCHCLIR